MKARIALLLRRLRIPAAIFLALLVSALILVPWKMRRAAAGSMYASVASVPARPVGIVLGALAYPDGTMSPMLLQRVQAGVALYKAGKVKKLLLTGNSSPPGYDEVGPMQAMTLQLGVPAKDILRDNRGYRTYDSFYNARAVFGIRSAVVVTQDFHMPRSLYLARGMRIDAVGYSAPSGTWFLPQIVQDIRERFASLEAVCDIHFRRRVWPSGR